MTSKWDRNKIDYCCLCGGEDIYVMQLIVHDWLLALPTMYEINEKKCLGLQSRGAYRLCNRIIGDLGDIPTIPLDALSFMKGLKF